DTLVHPLVVGYMVEVIYPTIPNGWRELPIGFGNIRVIQSLSKSRCVLVHSGWIKKESHTLFQSSQDNRTSWDPEPEGGVFQVEKEYGVGTSLLRRSGNQELILQHVSSGSMMLFSKVDLENPYNLRTEGFTIVP
ncbi:unnamed protein product, partial [Brassica napus]